MKAFIACCFCLCALYIPKTTAQDKPNTSPQSDVKWKIVRDGHTNDCLLTTITAYHPNYPEKLGEYKTQEEGKAALDKFKTTDDPNKSGFEMCTNK